MSLRSRRATTPVSSSASTTTRPATMCNPPAKRSITDTSALRADTFVTATRLNSSLTEAVIAIPGAPCCRSDERSLAGARSCVSPPLVPTPQISRFGQHRREGRRQADRIVPGGTGNRDVVQVQSRPEPGGRGRQALRQRHRRTVGQHRIDAKRGSVVREYVQVLLRRESFRLTH